MLGQAPDRVLRNRDGVSEGLLEAFDDHLRGRLEAGVITELVSESV